MVQSGLRVFLHSPVYCVSCARSRARWRERKTIENSGKRESLSARRVAREACDEGEGEEDEEKRVGRELDSTRLDSTRLDGGGGENVPEVEVAALGLGYPNWLLGLFARSLSLSLSLRLGVLRGRCPVTSPSFSFEDERY